MNLLKRQQEDHGIQLEEQKHSSDHYDEPKNAKVRPLAKKGTENFQIN